MPSRYWIASSGNWNDPANWSATSGGPGGASVPGAGDTAILEGMFRSCTLNAAATLGGLTIAGFTLSSFTISQELTVLADLSINTVSTITLSGPGKILLGGTANQAVNVSMGTGVPSPVITLNKPSGTVTFSGDIINLRSDLLRNPANIDPRSATTVSLVVAAGAGPKITLTGNIACQSFSLGTTTSELVIPSGVTLDTYSYSGGNPTTISGTGTIRVCAGQYTHIGSPSTPTHTVVYWNESTPPSTPTGFTATPVSQTRIDLTWNSVSGATGYLLQWSSDQVTWFSDQITWTGEQEAVLSCFVSGFTANTPCYFQLAAYNSNMAYSNFATANATTLPNAPGAPTGLAIASSSTTQISVSWNSVSGSTGYELQIATNSTFTTGLQTFTPTGTSQTVNSLTAGTTYYARVLSKNSGGNSAWSGTVSGPTLCVAPTGVTASPAGQSTDITVAFNTVTGATSYVVEWATTSGGTYTALPAVTTGTATHAVGSVNTERFYRVKAVNAGGNSANSQVVSTKTPPAAPTNLAATGITQTSFVVGFTAPTGATKNKVEYKAASAGTWTVAQDTAATSCTITGLTAGTEYNIRVSSDNL